MNALEKYAAKKKLTEKLFGKLVDISLEDIGLEGARVATEAGKRHARKLLKKGPKTLGTALGKGFARGKKTIDPKLLAGGVGAGALAALLSKKEKRASKHPPPAAKKEFIQGSKPTPPKSKKPFLNKLTSGKFSILPGLSNTTQKRGGSKPALGARLQWRF